MRKNLEVRKQAAFNGVPLWRVAQGFGVSEPTFCRWMREEFSQERKERALKIIEEAGKE